MSHRRRRRHELTLADKVEVIRLLESCTSQTEVARLFDCSQSQVSRIASKRDEILGEWESSGNSEQKRRRTTKDEVSDIPRELGNETKQETLVPDKPLEVKTCDSVQQPQKSSFLPSPPWFSRWKGRSMDTGQLGISLNWSRHLGGGGGGRRGRGRPKASANKESRISNQLLDVLKNYALCDVYAADELALFYSATPNLNHNTVDTSTTTEEQVGDCAVGQDIKQASKKECITLFLACNVTGSDKRDILVILDSNCRAPNMGLSLSGCHVAFSPGALMTVDIFRTWLIALDQAMRLQRRYILLLVNNTPPHESEVGKTLEHVRLLFMRPYATPFFHGLSHAIRTHYRHQLLLKLFSSQPAFFSASASSDDSKNIGRPLWTMDVHEAVAMLQRSWKSLGPQDIVPCFSKSGTCAPHIHGLPEPDVDELPELPETFITQEQFEDFVNIDADVECYGDSSLVSVACHISTAGDLDRLGLETKQFRDDAGAQNDSFSARVVPPFVTCHNGLDPGAGSGGGYGASTELGLQSSSGESVADVLGSLGVIRRFLNQRGLHLHNLHALEAQIHDCI